MGMELGIATGLLQPRLLGRMGPAAVSSASGVVSAAPGRLDKPPGIWRQLALSSAELCAASPCSYPARPATVERNESAGIRATDKSTAGNASPSEPTSGKQAAE